MAIVAERKNRALASEATILHSAINTAVAAFGTDGGKKAHRLFQKLVKALIGEKEDPAPRPEPEFPSRKSQWRGKP